MADQDAISLVFNESRRYTKAIEGCLETMAGITLSREYNGPIVWSLLEKQALFAIYEVAARCFELGAASVRLSHEVIAFLSGPGEINSTMPRSQSLPLSAAFEDITVASTEFQKAAKTALDAMMPVLREPHPIAGRRTIVQSNFKLQSNLTEKQHLPPGHWAEKLWEILSSLNAERIVDTGVKLNNAIAVLQGHVIRVCLYGSSLTEKFGPSLTASIDSPLMGTFHREVLPGAADYVGVLANYIENDIWDGCWDRGNVKGMLDENVISILGQLEIHLSDFPDEITLPLSELLTQYAVVFTSLLSTYSSTLAVEEYLEKLVKSHTHLLAFNPSNAFQPLLTHREVSQQALTQTQCDVNFLISRLKQFQEHSVVAGWPENIPEPLKCFEHVITTLLSHSETILPRQIHQWKWVMSEPKSGVTFLNAIRPLLLRYSITQRVCYSSRFTSLFLYHVESLVGNLAELDTQLPRTLQPPFPLHLAFGPHYDPQTFWTKLASLARWQQLYYTPVEVVSTSRGKPQDHWRSSTHKEQVVYRAQSHQVKSRFRANGQGNPTEVANLLKFPLNSKRTLGNASLKGGSFQGDWSF